MFKRILLAVDGSQHSAKAVPVAADLAKKSNSEVVVVHVREHAAARGGNWELEPAADADALVERVKSELAAAGVTVNGRVDRALAGRAAQAILDVASNEGADLIVMGTRGLSDLKGLLLGSVTHKVIQLSDCPVLVAR
jgi:nucleotide-binding universal stress UspA family protein